MSKMFSDLKRWPQTMKSFIFPILIYFLAFLPGVCHTPSCRSRWIYEHDFWHDDGSWVCDADFCKIGVIGQGQGQKSTKICLFWAYFGHRGHVWDYSGPGRVRWGTIGSMPTYFGTLPKVRERQEASSRQVSSCWQVASVAGKVPYLKKVPRRSIAR